MSSVSRSRLKKVATPVKRLAPCNSICPAGEDIQGWISLTKEKKYFEAWRKIIERNPFPSIHGRICYHYCETECNRTQYDSTVGIHCMERFLGDKALKERWKLPNSNPSTGKRVLIVGAGPAGLSAAFYLNLMGHSVTIYESLSKPGGTMFTGIPAYRLPKDVLFGEVNRVLDAGVEIEYNRKVEDVLIEKRQGGFEAVFLAIGSNVGRSATFPMEDPCGVLYAINYLREVAFDNPPEVGNRLVIYGGGNTAIDVARTAKRLGVKEIYIIYHRGREKMSAFPREIDEATEEGVKFICSRSILKLDKNLLTLSVNVVDQEGHIQQTGETEQLEVDTLIFALSQIPDSEFLRKIPEIEVQSNGVVNVDEFFMTGHGGIFAAGDMIPFERSVTISVGQGRRVANYINAYLSGTIYNEDPNLELACFNKLRISDEKSNVTEQKNLAPKVRVNTFDEVVQDCSEEEVLYEAGRCFSCGNCFGCAKCYTSCPVNVIEHSEDTKKVTSINTKGCIGCTKCVRICPCGALMMIDR